MLSVVSQTGCPSRPRVEREREKVTAYRFTRMRPDEEEIRALRAGGPQQVGRVLGAGDIRGVNLWWGKIGGMRDHEDARKRA